jgi:hypothetical protein
MGEKTKILYLMKVRNFLIDGTVPIQENCFLQYLWGIMDDFPLISYAFFHRFPFLSYIFYLFAIACPIFYEIFYIL